MMAGQDREGGALFHNARKTSHNAPDYKGDLRVSHEVVQSLVQQMNSGVQFPVMDLGGWKKTSGSGNVFISMRASKLYERGGQAAAPQQQAKQAFPGPAPLPDDEIPF